eukprot:2396076-Rhodomonas_salina.1
MFVPEPVSSGTDTGDICTRICGQTTTLQPSSASISMRTRHRYTDRYTDAQTHRHTSRLPVPEIAQQKPRPITCAQPKNTRCFMLTPRKCTLLCTRSRTRRRGWMSTWVGAASSRCAMPLRACSAMPGTDTAYGTVSLRACYVMPGTYDSVVCYVLHGSTELGTVLSWGMVAPQVEVDNLFIEYLVRPSPLCPYAFSGTDVRDRKTFEVELMQVCPYGLGSRVWGLGSGSGSGVQGLGSGV